MLPPLQRRILVEAVDLIANRSDEPLEAWVPYGDLFRACEHHWVTKPERSWHRQDRARRSAFSRALRGLRDKGLLCGLALAWVNPEDEVVFGWQGGSEPRIRLVGVTEKGLAAIEERFPSEGLEDEAELREVM